MKVKVRAAVAFGSGNSGYEILGSSVGSDSGNMSQVRAMMPWIIHTCFITAEIEVPDPPEIEAQVEGGAA